MKHITPSLPNLAVLRAEAIELLHTSSDVKCDLREIVTLGAIIRREAKSWNTPLLNYIEYDIHELEIPRFTALAGWLAPYSLASQYPNALVRVARFLLGTTRDAEMSAVDWVKMKQHYPEL